jgi:hypothetical protein
MPDMRSLPRSNTAVPSTEMPTAVPATAALAMVNVYDSHPTALSCSLTFSGQLSVILWQRMPGLVWHLREEEICRKTLWSKAWQQAMPISSVLLQGWLLRRLPGSSDVRNIG